jgi:3-phenylpropionate/cinnamic acid dioxygenase small subunit
MTLDVSPELARSIERFLYAEAQALEDNRFDDWLECFSDDVRYWMPVRENVETSRRTQDDFDLFALYDDDKDSLRLRVLRIQTGHAHAEVPLSVTQRYITNVLPKSSSSSPDEALRVSSNFMVYQERRGRHAVTFYGRREDTIFTQGRSFKIKSRRIDLAQTILPTTISIFF